MDFFERQHQAKKKTGWLIFLFFVAVLFIGLLNFFLIGMSLSLNSAYEGEGDYTRFQDPVLAGIVLLATFGIIALAGLFRKFQLREGGSSIAAMMDGRLVNMGTRDPDERKLLNVVEEMAIASGVPMPEVYVMDQENGINAFAAGFTVDDAVIGVTNGCMRMLSRDELQGVVAHEFSHILNQDMRLNLRLVAVIFGLVVLAELGRIFLHIGSSSSRSRSRNSEGSGGGIALIGLILMATSGLGILMGKMIKSAVSRQREYLADSSAVQFTRNPAGLSGALKKIGAAGAVLHSPKASEASHMFFGNALKKSWFSFTSTHPPLLERIQLLEPSFDGDFSGLKFEQRQVPPESSSTMPPHQTTQAGLSIPGLGQAIPPVIGAVAVEAAASAVRGGPSSEHVDFATALLRSLPEKVRGAAHDTYDSCALIYALMLDKKDEVVRGEQLEIVQNAFGDQMANTSGGLFDEVLALDPRAKLPVAELAVSSLRRLAQEQYECFINVLEALAAADEQIDLFEYSLSKLVIRHLEPHFENRSQTAAQIYSLKRLGSECHLLLSGLAHAAGDEFEVVVKAYQSGKAILADEVETDAQPMDQFDLDALDQALTTLAACGPKQKTKLIEAAAATVSADGYLQIQEAELLRAIADSLGCPIPPLAIELDEAA
tara:strand:+ start:550 stop:2523 length:1974 start_codon:yes stop_codon:yes gene_type:complete